MNKGVLALTLLRWRCMRGCCSWAEMGEVRIERCRVFYHRLMVTWQGSSRVELKSWCGVGFWYGRAFTRTRGGMALTTGTNTGSQNSYEYQIFPEIPDL